MATYSVWMLGASNITVSGGKSLGNSAQGEGTHLLGETIRLDTNDWQETFISDGGQDTDFDDNDSNQRLDGAQTINGTAYGNATRLEAEYRLTLRDPATGDTWDVLGYNVNDSNPAYATIEGLAFVGPPGGFPPIGRDLEVIDAFEGPGSYGQPAIDAGDLASPPCFTPGTLIRTRLGEVAIETLQAGDWILTMDSGYQPIRWIGKRCLDAIDLAANPKLRPVRIRAGALGHGLPETDLTVSRQHRVLVSSVIAERMFGAREILIPAIKLVDLDGIDIVEDAQAVEYWHMLFDCHQVVWSNGAPTESLFAGPEALKSVSPEGRAEIIALFPEITRPEFHAVSARLIPHRGRLMKQLVARHSKNDKPLLSLGHGCHQA